MTKKYLLILIICTVTGACLGFIARPRLQTWYSNFCDNHFSEGDKVYANEFLFTDPYSNIIALYRVVQPINDADPEAEPYVVYLNKSFYENLMDAQQSAFIGTYVNHEVLTVKIANGTTFTNFYAIKPNRKALNEPNFQDTPPKGYKWKDNTLYNSI